MVLVFTLAISVLTGLLFGLIPVMRFGTPSVVALKEGGRSASDAPGRHRARNALVVSEIALALVLLIVSGLMIRTFIALRQVDPGFVRPTEVQTFRVSIPEALIKDPQQVVLAYEQITQRLEQVPGVVSVGLSSSVTMDGNGASTPIFVEEFPDTGRAMPPLRRVQTRRARLLRDDGQPGARRACDRLDRYPPGQARRGYFRESRARVLEESCRRPWASGSGRARRIPGEKSSVLSETNATMASTSAATAIVYWPMLIKEWWTEPIDISRTIAYVVRSTRVGSPGFLRELQQAVWSVNPNLPLASVRTLDEIQADSMAQTSFALVMLAIAATVALLLGSVGIYGVIAYVATQRTREIGIRMALGAQTGDVRRLFLRHGLLLTGAGIALGIRCCAGDHARHVRVAVRRQPDGSRDLRRGRGGPGERRPVGDVSSARRASRIDPVVALRSGT